ncbi:thermonuclease family protein [Niveispirillum sp. KHB5.9]|uniref:thermonuclease family protein n=1 Tax=Niveispirillum sp. KHB5.9 TaxID=3400269 RepID=UPI003A86C90F
MKTLKFALPVLILIGIGAGVLTLWPRGRVEQEGAAAVIDAGLLEIAGTRHRLAGIVPPLPDQHCVDRKGTTWPCGQEAVEGLWKLVTGTPVYCRPHPASTDLSDCFVGGTSLSERMVRGGWALACRFGRGDLSNWENNARFLASGLWRGGFVPPTPLDQCAG